ncbi:hypothetical protein GGI35DRAFT_109554 [Trichoderma velutinum]
MLRSWLFCYFRLVALSYPGGALLFPIVCLMKDRAKKLDSTTLHARIDSDLRLTDSSAVLYLFKREIRDPKQE